ncbi:MAG: class D beta-lactamase [Azospirillaceae bacterium]|nr:class D beta-lactamase [Azospirillaceae bacterium]
MKIQTLVLAALLAVIPAEFAAAATICTAIADAKTGDFLRRDGDCVLRVTPASTFKIAISLMGFDSGFLTDEHQPSLAFQPGDVDWGGEAWRQPTDPERWIKYSVVWFSRRVTHGLGEDRVKAYAAAFHYGNADITGDPGQHNGLDRAWISSSLKISPMEQIAFLTALVNRRLPVRAQAVDMTEHLTAVARLPDGWDIHGKTGTAFPRDADGRSDEAHGYGWFVGWARNGEQTLVFAWLTQDEAPAKEPAGLRTRDGFLAAFPSLIGAPAPAP